MNRAPEHTSKFYAKGALEYLVDILVMTLTSQVGYEDPETCFNGHLCTKTAKVQSNLS